MAKNMDYTCDVCGLQFNTGDGYLMTLTGYIAYRKTEPSHGFHYDLCEDCAKKMKAEIRNSIIKLGSAVPL